MKTEDLMDAMAYVDDALLESAANSLVEKKRYAPLLWLLASAACITLAVGIWALYQHRVPPLDSDPILQIGTMGQNQPTQETPGLSDPTHGTPSSTEPIPGYRPSPVVGPFGEVPKYHGAQFSAAELGELFPGAYGDTVVYEQVGFPDDTLSGLPKIPTGEHISVYQSTHLEAAKEETVLGVMYDILPRLEKLLGVDIPVAEVETEGAWFATTPENYIMARNYTNGIVVSCKTGSRYTADSNDPALEINGVILTAKNTDTDQTVMGSISSVIPYLEELFDMELSSFKIFRDYSDDGQYLYQMTVYLYSEDHVTDQFQEQYDDYPRRYLAGEALCLNFSPVSKEWWNWNTVVCREIEFVSQPRQWFTVAGQYEMLSLDEAEELLAKGYVFSSHVCRLCMQEQQRVDFTDYDRVSLEYVYGKGYGIPFYTFYKKLGENADGSVNYAKTMVPAIEATGMEEYFENQIQYHLP